MTITTTFESPRYRPEIIDGRYVKFNGFVDPPRYEWIETGRENPKSCRCNYRCGTVDECDLPPEIAAKAKAQFGTYPPYVDWPV